MALYVNTNVSSINAQRKLTNATNSLNVSYQRLASGLRINSAKDDAAGLQIADRLTSQINGLNQGNRNTNDGIALAQTIEGALDETTNMLQRIRTLAVQSANGTNTAEDRKALQEEVESLSLEISRIAQQTTFAGATVLDGIGDKSLIPKDGANKGIMVFQVGANAGDTLNLIWCKAFNVSGIMQQAGIANIGANAANGLTKVEMTIDGKKVSKAVFTVETASKATNTLTNIDKFIQLVDAKRSELGAIQNYTHANHSNIKQYNLMYLF